MTQSTRAAIEEAAQEFESALLHDPNYALAHAELALAILYRTRGTRKSTQGVARATPHVEQAMALDPTLAEAHAATGYLSWTQEKFEDAMTNVRHAVQIKPNYVIAYVWMGNLLDWKLARYDATDGIPDARCPRRSSGGITAYGAGRGSFDRQRIARRVSAAQTVNTTRLRPAPAGEQQCPTTSKLSAPQS